jgi:hypothetical protein
LSWTGINYIVDQKPDRSTMLLVLNQGDMPYRRDARLRNARGYGAARLVAQGTWEAHQHGGPVALKTEGDSLTRSFDMAPRSFTLFEFRK